MLVVALYVFLSQTDFPLCAGTAEIKSLMTNEAQSVMHYLAAVKNIAKPENVLTFCTVICQNAVA